jgi:hypothetical protein
VARALLRGTGGEWFAVRVRRAVLAPLVSALTLAPAAGCIVPTQLEAQRSATTPGPVITDGKPVDFQTVFFTPPAATTAWTFGVTAVDENLDATLEAHLYIQKQAQLFGLGSSILTARAADLTTRDGEFFQQAYCVTAATTGENLFYVYVADTPFPPSDDPTQLRAGHFDFKYWVVKCP